MAADVSGRVTERRHATQARLALPRPSWMSPPVLEPAPAERRGVPVFRAGAVLNDRRTLAEVLGGDTAGHQLVSGLRSAPPGMEQMVANGHRVWSCTCGSGWLCLSGEPPHAGWLAHVEG